MEISREAFIRLGAALGVGAAAASLAACGGGSGASSGASGGSNGGSGGGSGGGSNGGSGGEPSTPAASGSSEEAAAGGSGGSSGAAIAREADVAPGSAVKFKDSGRDAVLAHLESGQFVAYSAVCTHAACTVAYRNAQLACPCHGSIFDPANGAEVVSGPAPTPLTEIPIEVRNGEVVKA